MSRQLGLLAVLVAVVLAPAVAQGRGYRRGGYVSTPFGTAKTNSPEWRMSGGNIFVYQQLMEQKMMMLQQQQMMKIQKRYMQQMQKMAKQHKQQPSAPQTALPATSNVTTLAPKRKKKRVVKNTPPAVSATASNEEKTESAAKKPKP